MQALDMASIRWCEENKMWGWTEAFRGQMLLLSGQHCDMTTHHRHGGFSAG